MPSYSVSASEIKYASGSSWTSGKARQGVYSSTRYEGALNFAGLANFSFSNIAITGIQMRVTFGPTGGSSTKYLTLYGGAKNSISGSIASMRGSALGAVSVSNAFDRTVTLNFNSGSEAAIYSSLVNFFISGNRVLILYVPKTRGTYSGGYCYDYLSVTAMTLTFYRCKSDGTRDDVAGTYAYVKADFSCSAIGSNKVSVNAALSQIGGSYTTSTMLTSGSGVILGGGNLAVDATYSVVITATDTVGSVSTYSGEVSSAAYIMHVKKGGKALGFGMAAGADETVSFGWPLILSKPLAVAQGGTGANTTNGACSAIGAVKKSGDTMSGNLNIATSLYPSICLLPSYNNTTNRTIFEGSYIGASSFSSWEDSTGNNRRMLEIRNAAYQASLDYAVMLRTCVNGTWGAYRVFHAGMPTPVPIANGGTGASSAKAALSNLGIFYAASLPSTGTDGQICLVPV